MIYVTLDYYFNRMKNFIFVLAISLIFFPFPANNIWLQIKFT